MGVTGVEEHDRIIIMANERARRLRRNTTDAEKVLWRRIRYRQISNARFRRQHPIDPYVVDFYCAELRLVIAVDGGQHELRSDQDAARTRWLESQGYRVVRFWNNDVLGNVEGGLERIVEILSKR